MISYKLGQPYPTYGLANVAQIEIINSDKNAMLLKQGQVSILEVYTFDSLGQLTSAGTQLGNFISH